MVLDARTLDLAPVAAELVAGLADPRFVPELPAAQLEIVTPVCGDAAQVGRELAAAHRHLAECAGGALRFAGSGTHAFAAPVGPLSALPRYAAIAEEYEWAARQSIVFGQHVHVCLRGAERVMAVHDALRSYLPELAALAGNAPFLGGRDTGLASVRPKVAEAYPRQGIPPAFVTWEAYADLLAWGARGGAVPEPTYLWWEVRPHPRFATLEIRVLDAPTTAAQAAGLAAVVRALVAWLADRWDQGRPLPVHDGVRIAENRWRALRHGLGGRMLDLDTGEEEPTRRRVAQLMDVLEPVAAAQGDAMPFGDARSLCACSGAERQRAVAASGGPAAVVAWQEEQFT